MECFQYASDLHQELTKNYLFLKKTPIIKSADYLILAGDISLFSKYPKTDLFEWCSKNYKETFVVPGNHEYYDGSFVDDTYFINNKLFPNVTVVNNISVIINNTQLFFTTLWSDIDKQYESTCKQYLNDFYKIKWFNPIQPILITKQPELKNYGQVPYRTVFSVCKNWLEHELLKSTAQYKVVVTHHCPIVDLTVYNKKDPMTTCFNVDMTYLMDKVKIDYWIYGHTHTNLNDYIYNGCVVTSNQLGYVHCLEADTFSRTKYNPGLIHIKYFGIIGFNSTFFKKIILNDF
ncbi:hypothetical protein EIN_039580 [Entamoeba invadens IP1]|uniref:Calcineurin-like phosphoesterase domain-containing protein n=1 Tax=Entamoeba invadens IP1 TaxID=370355 RepID=A0A0A1TWG2_ENTIV|nr:hypothetical protein EIN_039580 [Entamoeba invadens IP1]ELP85474.1 hypothetical protein EIN_039580 [Entamoeba invadens IP1]|eukprot:XP_004184820.1 hypothetical protein EIN_039580 [Entamoeba invadens IP1]